MDANITWFHKIKKEFDIRKSTLHDRVTNLHAKEPRRPCELDGATEKTLAELVDVVAEWGYPGRIRDQDDGPELPRHQGRSFGSLPEQLARRSLTEGVRQEVPDVSKRGIEHPAGKSDDIARGRERVFWWVVCRHWRYPRRRSSTSMRRTSPTIPAWRSVLCGVVLAVSRWSASIRRLPSRWCGAGRRAVPWFPRWWYTRRSTSTKVGRRSAHVGPSTTVRRVGGSMGEPSRDGFCWRSFRQLKDRNVLLGDNLASHFTSEVIRAAQLNNVYFCALPPRRTWCSL